MKTMTVSVIEVSASPHQVRALAQFDGRPITRKGKTGSISSYLAGIQIELGQAFDEAMKEDTQFVEIRLA